MKKLLKSTVKKVIAKSFFLKQLTFRVLAIYAKIKSQKAKKVFEQAPKTPVWLEREMLDTLSEQQKDYFSSYVNLQSVSDEKRRANLYKRDEVIAKDIADLIRTCLPAPKGPKNLLEIGSQTGILSYFLQRMGYLTTAIDLNSKRFEEKAIQEGVKLLEMDATKLQFEDESFDFIFSFNAFEHINDPEAALREMIRVCKSGGYIYLCFDPLYMSPLGLHAIPVITVPYCQFFWKKELLQNVADCNFPHVNEWPLEKYRQLWNDYDHILNKKRYHEGYNIRHLDLIMAYPSCFKSKTENFDNLIVSGIQVLFQKKH
ncbi:MAG: class I SAM-dependent methyltransferase [Candidatus Parabeggiatoa sp.]|nr:class I SAM-dependent methyltransferase [Candidatus Parabeggiatoa sp.]